jgi:uncharacterized protein
MPLNEHWVSFDVHGQRLHGMLHLPTALTAPHPCVLLLHGFTGTHLEPHRLFALMARQLAAAGIAAYRFDFRGSGDSEGDFSEMTISRELEDARAALNLLRSRGEIDASRMGVLGLSMGGLVAALVAGIEDLKALCLWAPAAPETVLTSFAGQPSARIHGAFAAGFPGAEFPPGIRFDASSGRMDFGGNPVSKEFFLDAQTHDSLQAVKHHKGSSLVVHGTNDPTVPFALGERYAAALGVEVHAVPGAGHTFESIPHAAEARRVTLEFFQGVL